MTACSKPAGRPFFNLRAINMTLRNNARQHIGKTAAAAANKTFQKHLDKQTTRKKNAHLNQKKFRAIFFCFWKIPLFIRIYIYPKNIAHKFKFMTRTWSKCGSWIWITTTSRNSFLFCCFSFFSIFWLINIQLWFGILSSSIQTNALLVCCARAFWLRHPLRFYY